MADRRDQGSRSREYPPVREKLAPIALGIIAAITVVLVRLTGRVVFLRWGRSWTHQEAKR